MISRRTAAFLFLSAGAWLSMGVAPSRAQPSLSSSSPSYTISVTLDPMTRRLDGRARIQWRAAEATATDHPRFTLTSAAPGAAVIDAASVRVTLVDAGIA